MRVLEIGLGLPPAFAGMLLAEQGHTVTRWLKPNSRHDPLLEDELVWWWSMHGKDLMQRHAREVNALRPGAFNAIIDNLRTETWERWGVNREATARRLGVPWVTLADDCGYRSTGAIALARSWWSLGVPTPPQLAETTAGLVLAFKLLSLQNRSGWHRVGFAAALQKLMPAELQLGNAYADEGPHVDAEWMAEGTLFGARAEWRGELLAEPVRSREWKLQHMPTSVGRVRL